MDGFGKPSVFQRVLRVSGMVVLATSLTLAGGVAPGRMIATAHAEDLSSLEKDLAGASDFRLRVTAALALGRSHNSAEVGPLTRALTDSNASVRVAVAAALVSLGDSSAVGSLRAASARESDSDVKTALDDAIAKLGSRKARFLIQIGRLDNKSGSSSSEVTAAFKSATRSRVSSLPGCELLSDGTDAAAESARRGVPAVVLDGNLSKLTKSNAGSDVGYAAHVEFMMRKIPDQSLKSSISGDAKALATASGVGDRELSQLQVDAVTAATQSALKGAPVAIEEAAK